MTPLVQRRRYQQFIPIQQRVLSLLVVITVSFYCYSNNNHHRHQKNTIRLPITTSEAFVLAITPKIQNPSSLLQRRTASEISKKSTTSTIIIMSNAIHLRGGSEQHEQQQQQQQLEVSDDVSSNSDDRGEGSTSENDLTAPILSQQSSSSSSSSSLSSLHQLSMIPIVFISHLVRTFSTRYTMYLDRYPIYTKSITAGIIFAMSDILAQLLTKETESNNSSSTTPTTKNMDWTRTLSSAAVGLFYFGPAAHYWYNWIFRILPTTSIVSTLQKAALGQLLFGPSFTCIFFATSLMQSGTFSIKNWIIKIRTDFMSAWLAGVGFWPIVDLISYSYVPQSYIPLFINICSFFWTTYLVLKSYK